MSKRIFITLSDAQHELLKSVMEMDTANNVSAYFAMLLTNRKDEKTKRPAGRPRKEDESEEEEIANIPNPNKMDAKYRPLLTKTEYDGWMALNSGK